MKIIQITPYYPPHTGGIENVVKEISESLAKRGHQVEVFTSDIGSKKDKLISTKNLKIYYLKSFIFANTPIIPSLFFKLMRIHKDSILHLHAAPAFIPEVVYLISKIKKIPYIVHIHLEAEPSGKLGFLLPFYKKIILKRVLKSASRIIVLGKEYRTLINNKYNILENIMIIPNGVGEEFFINKENTSSKHTNLLFVGRLSAQKNIPKLIDSIYLIKSKVVLHIVGDGEKKIEIEKLISDKKLKNVILHGKKTGKNLINFYKNADIFILTSNVEAMPLVLLEAMASGTPIVASDVLGSRELVGKSGILVSPPTPDNFARAIDNLIEDKILMDILSKRGREKAKNYDWNKIVEKFVDVYGKVLNENK
ncbi:MAG: glycosyltransferase family 4 protein [Candidatus Humimicrobiaceae bacterium]